MASMGEVQEKLRDHLGLGLGLRPHSDGHVLRAGAPAPLPTRADSSDLRPGDLVSRLLAATPPYLYSLPHPTSFFFSEMLRSLVAAKTGDTPAPPTRRPRKRTWRDAVKAPHPPPHPHPLSAADKPLELTTPRAVPQADDKQPPPLPTAAPSPPVLPPPNMGMTPCGMLPPLPSPDSALPPDLLLPPAQPPLWYPPLYPLPPHQPPYPIDPLHFFIDLRVSGHIFDRKSKEDDAPVDDSKAPPLDLGSASSLVRQTKHCSAFSVPQPRSRQLAGSPKEAHSPSDNLGPNYVLQNLSRIYDDVRPFGQRRAGHGPSRCNNLLKGMEDNNNIGADDSKPIVVDEQLPRVDESSNEKEKVIEENKDGESKEESEAEKKKKKDIRALLGLELVVDYVNQDDVPRKQRRSDSREDGSVSDDDEDDEEVLAVKDEDSDSSPEDKSKRCPSRPRSPALGMSVGYPQHPLTGTLGHNLHHFQTTRPTPPPYGHPHFMRDAPDALNLQIRQ